MLKSIKRFNVGDAVTFEAGARARRAAQTVTGVVVKVTKGRRGFRYAVRSTDGKQWTADESILSPAKLTKSKRAKLAADGNDFEAKRDGVRQSRNDKRSDDIRPRLQSFIDNELTRPALCRAVWYAHPKFGWTKVTLIDVDLAKGKAKITNRASELVEMFGPIVGRSFRATVWVLGSRVVPVDASNPDSKPFSLFGICG